MLNSAPIAALKVLSISQCKMWLIFPAACYLITEHIFGIIINSWQHGMLLFHKIRGKQLGVQQWEWLVLLAFCTYLAELRNRRARGYRVLLSRCGSTLLFPEHGKCFGHSAPFGIMQSALTKNHIELYSLQTCRRLPLFWIYTEPGMFTLCSHLNPTQLRNHSNTLHMVYMMQFPCIHVSYRVKMNTDSIL